MLVYRLFRVLTYNTHYKCCTGLISHAKSSVYESRVYLLNCLQKSSVLYLLNCLHKACIRDERSLGTDLADAGY